MYTAFVNPFFLGVWLLRSSNDYNFQKGTTFLEIKEDYKFELYTKFNDGIFGKTFKRIGYVNKPYKFLSRKIDLLFTHKELFSYSVLGFKIPDTATKYFEYEKPKKYVVNREGTTIIVKDDLSELFYIFDLYVNEYNTPSIETKWNNFLFIQFMSFLLNLLLVQFMNYSTLETREILQKFF